jgi:hypothetical protein
LSKRDELAVARALLAKAAGDEAGLRALADRDDVPDHVAGFHRIGTLATVAAVRTWADRTISEQRSEPPDSPPKARETSDET